MKMKGLYAVALVLSLSMPLYALAHPEGASWEGVVGAYTVAVGYSEEPTVGKPVVFDFFLYDGERADVSFDNVWVRLGNEKGVVLSGRLTGSNDKTIFNYKFLEPGKYTLLARYSREGDVLAEHTFPFSVETELADTPGSKNSLAPDLPGGVLSAIVAFLLGGAITYFVKRGERG